MIGRSRVGVLGDVGVEQEDRRPPDLDRPDRDLEVAARQRDADRQRLAVAALDPPDRQPAQVVVGVGVLLVAVGIDRLVEVAAAVHQPDADERQRHVRGRLHVVAGEDAETARVDPERLVQPVLGAEVGDRTRQLVGVMADEPAVRAVLEVAVEVAQDARGPRP